MADRKISDLTALTTPAAGDYLPIIDISEPLAANKNKRITIEELLRGAPDGTAGAPSFAFESDGGNGFYLAGTDTIGVSTNGVNRLTLSTSALTSTVPISATSFTPTSSTVPTNGLYLPAANSVALSTNGAGRLFVDASGRILAGANSTSGASTFYDDIVVTNSTAGTGAGITLVANATNGFNAIDFGDTDAVGRGRFTYSHADDSLRIDTAGTERLRITSAGLVGIGTSSPSALLHVSSTGAVESLLSGGGTTGDTVLHLKGNGNAYKFIVPNTTAQYGMGLYDVGNAAYRLFVNSSGRVGIGTTSPGYALHVSGTGAVSSRTFATDATGDASFFVQNDGNGICGPLVYGSTKTAYGALASNETAFYSNRSTTIMADGASTVIKFATGGNTERLRITSTGQLSHIGAGSTGSPAVSFNGSAPSNSLVITSAGLVGIGTSSPNTRLSVVGTATGLVNGAIRTNTTAATQSANSGLWLCGNQSTSHYNWLIASQFNVGGALEITPSTAVDGATFTTPTAVFTQTGRVGIGTTSPAEIFSVAATASATAKAGAFYFATAGNIGDQNSIVIGTAATSTRGVAIAAEKRNADNAHDLVFKNSRTAAEPVEAARIDSSGRLLVGTSTSAGTGAKLQIRNDANNYHLELFEANTAATEGPAIWLSRSRGTSSSPAEVSNGDALGYIVFRGYDSVSYKDAAYIYSVADGDWTTAGDTTDNPSALLFSTTADGASSPTERMRISSAGVQNISSSSNGHSSYLTAAAGTTTYAYRAVHSHTAGNFGTGTVSFYVWSNGDVVNTNNSYGAISDIKLKENIVNASSQWDDIKALQVRNYNLKEGQTHTQIGLIAQEVELVSPGLVSESPDRDEDGNDLGTVTKSVNYSVLYMKAVKALQEAMERIETLEAKVAALEGA